MADKLTLKKLFADGSMPNGADFAQLIESLRLLNEPVPMTLVIGLKGLLEQMERKITQRVPMVRLQYMVDSGVYPDVGNYWYVPTSGVLIYNDGKSSQHVELRHDTLYVNDDAEHGYPVGLYALNDEGKLAKIV